MNQRELDTAVAKYLEAEAAYMRMGENYQVVKAGEPTQPSQVSSVQEWEDFDRCYQDWQEKVNVCKKAKELAFEDWAEARRLLCALLPPKVWFKWEDKAIGKVYDGWGGGHWEVRVQDWAENLPPLKEATYN